MIGIGSVVLDSSIFWSNNKSKSELTFHCLGNETELFNCRIEPQMTVCEQFQSAAVICQGNHSCILSNII